MKKQLFSSKKRRKTNRPKLIVLTAYGGVFTLIVSVIAVGYQPPQPIAADSTATASAVVQTPLATPDTSKPTVDELVASDVAVNLAVQTNMAIAPNVANLSVSLAAKDALAQTSDTAIVKPEVIQPTIGSQDVTTYVVRVGDTVDTVAASHGLQPATVKWANDLVNNSLTPGRSLTILPVDGVLYTVQSGDTTAGLASTYKASEDRIISFNNLEISGLKPGQKIVIPSGVLPTEQRPGYVAPRVSILSFSGISAGGNGYAYGYCTYYAAARRAQLGKPIPGNWGNANSWAYYAAAQGFSVGNTPQVGAIMQNGGGLGHVAIVEAVNPGVSITISEMNGYRFGGGWNRVGRGDISWGQATSGGYRYIY